MALLYRMGTGNGSGSDIKPYTVNFECASGYIGQTLTMKQSGQDNVSGIVGSDGKLTLYPMYSGEWECSCYSSVVGAIKKKTIDLSYWGVQPTVTFRDTPKGATVTPTDNVQTWLNCADIWDKSYTTISEVIADTTTLNILISDNNASDYLARSTTWTSDVCSNESAMTYIGLNDYCANKLLADNMWRTAICNSTYFKKVLTENVPAMTSNTSDDGGMANASSQWEAGYEPYLAFNGDTSKTQGWVSSTSNAGEWLNYEFPIAIKPYVFDYKSGNYYSNKALKAFKIQGSNDGTNYTDLTDEIECSDTNLHSQVLLTKNLNIPYKYIRLYTTQNTGTNAFNGVAMLQFYGREEA